MVYLFVNHKGVDFLNELTRREREQKKREIFIISKAEELFNQYGFEKVTMDDLSKEAEYTKRTLYRYFTCKEDLLYAVILKGNKRLYDMIMTQCKNGSTGFDKIQLAYDALYDFYCRYPQLFAQMNQIGILKSHSVVDMPYRQKYLDFDQHLFSELFRMFKEGQDDKSIRSDLDISKLTFSSVYMITGFFHMLSFSGNSFTTHFHLDKEDFIKFTIEMQLETFRNKTK